MVKPVAQAVAEQVKRQTLKAEPEQQGKETPEATTSTVVAAVVAEPAALDKTET
jgi:hypothetical protein